VPTNTGTHPLKRTRSKAEERAVQRLRRICLALPGVTEKIAWGELTWRVGKIFAQMDTHHHGAEHVAVWLPARPGVQESLIEEYPEYCFRPPYVGHKGWIGVRIDRDPDWNVVAGLVREAYREVASPRLLTRLEAERDASRQRWGGS
jgi:predicted DNA-binding protein (MmcQ/YjbR family)